MKFIKTDIAFFRYIDTYDLNTDCLDKYTKTNNNKSLILLYYSEIIFLSFVYFRGSGFLKGVLNECKN